MRYILAFLSGVAALAIITRASSDRTNSYLSLAPRKIETRVTIYVKEDPTKAAQDVEFSNFLDNVGGLNETEKKQILAGAISGFISEVRFLRVSKLSAGEEDTRGIVFDVVDGRFSRHVGTFQTHIGPPQKQLEPLQLRVPLPAPGR